MNGCSFLRDRQINNILLALTLNPSPEESGTLRSGSLLPQGEGLGMRACEDGYLSECY
jgi:hypothetical protein